MKRVEHIDVRKQSISFYTKIVWLAGNKENIAFSASFDIYFQLRYTRVYVTGAINRTYRVLIGMPCIQP